MEPLYYGPDHVQLTKVNWRLKVNSKFFLQKFRNIFTIHFTCSESCALSKLTHDLPTTSKVNCKNISEFL